ncbi:uncharacterized protein [Rutidosis leptorrhynchoides]|uniref:uncharacterized protein n=1 Tax=Rutidosis leptorrhynchoides TaxID=125765 RepID=UPI003A999801
MSQEQGYVEAKLTMKNMLNVIPQLKASMTENQQKIFRGTCFGPWLDLSYTGNDPGLVHAMLQRKSERPIGIDEKYPADDEEIWFSFRPNFKIRFSRREFCLITGFKFSRRTDMAHYIPRSYDVETPPIRRRCFPNRKVNSNITITDIQKLLYDGADFVVSDDDVVRLAIILIVERAFMGKQGIHVVSKKYLWLVEDFAKLNDYPWGNRIWDATYPVVKDGFQARESQLEVGKGYTLVGFMWSFKIWILEAYRRTIKSFAHKTDKNGAQRCVIRPCDLASRNSRRRKVLLAALRLVFRSRRKVILASLRLFIKQAQGTNYYLNCTLDKTEIDKLEMVRLSLSPSRLCFLPVEKLIHLFGHKQLGMLIENDLVLCNDYKFLLFLKFLHLLKECVFYL